MRFKYAVSANSKVRPGSGLRGRPVDANSWSTGPDPITHDKYYAWLKHRSQARYRGEDYELTWEDWQTLWTNELWSQRGKSNESVCLARKDFTEGWDPANVEIIPRIDQIRRQKEYKQSGK
jgi:hypothetical protein